MKTCTKCHLEKEESKINFAWITSKGRYEAQCKECRNAKRKEILKSKPKTPRKKRERKNPEYYKAYRKQWHEKNKDKVRKQVHQNYLKNKDKVLERTRLWRQENKDKFTEYWKKSNEKDKSKRRARKIVYYNLSKGNIIKPDICAGCFMNKELQAHHENYKEPLNIIWLCTSCHAYKHRKYK